MKLALKILGLCSLFFIEVVQSADNPECQFWNQLADKLSHADEQSGGTLQFACNSSCSNMTCNGNFKPSMFATKFEMDLCFGLRLNPCENPVSMDYYINIPNADSSKVINMSGSIAHNSSFDVPGPTIAGFKTTIVVIVEMVKVNSSFVLFGISADVRADVGGLPTFRQNRKVLPPMYIDVPPCTDDMKNLAPMKPPAVCTPLPTKATTPHTPPKTTKAMSTPKPVSNSKTYQKSCELGVEDCEEYEMCRATTDENTHSRSGVCQCQPDTTFDGKTGYCKPTSQTTQQSKTGSTAKPSNVPSVTIAMKTTDKGKKGGMNTGSTAKPSNVPSVTIAMKSTDKGKKAGMNMTAVIIGGVFGGLLLIVVIVSVIIFLGRRRRQADYRGDHQLLSDTDDGDDTNVVI